MNFKKKNFCNLKILVSGASGSIGSEIVKQLVKKKCKVIRALSNDEDGIYNLSEKFSNNKSDSTNKIVKHMSSKRIRYLIGDIRDYKRCLEATKNIDVVIHAAAMKHVPICEYNKDETVKTNIKGTENLAKASLKNKVKKFLLISTDKAVYPSSYMGKSKKKAEEIMIKFNKENKTKFSSIRFGNVIGSRGSVLLKFKKQIKNSENITITDKNMTRFFITIEAAVREVLNAIKILSGAEIFIIRNLKAFKIYELALAIRKYFKSKSKISFTGIRDGEKLFEQMLYEEEANRLYFNRNLCIIKTSLKKKINKRKEDVYKKLNSKFAVHLKSREIISYLKRNNLI